MPIFIHSNGKQEGPYEVEDLRQSIKNGSLAVTDLAWREGMAEWVPLGEMLAEQPAGVASAEPPTVNVKTDSLSIWSLVLGILSWVCLSIIAGIPAIICGHLSLKRQKSNPLLQGKGMAIAGLVLGYVSILLLFVIIPALALPSISGALSRADETGSLNRARQIGLALVAAGLDDENSRAMQALTGDTAVEKPKGSGWPAEVGAKTSADVKQQLIDGNYLTEDAVDKIGFENFLIGNVSEKDTSDTILVKSKTATSGVTVVVLKSGEGFIQRDGKPSYGMDPPRDPPFLE